MDRYSNMQVKTYSICQQIVLLAQVMPISVCQVISSYSKIGIYLVCLIRCLGAVLYCAIYTMKSNSTGYHSPTSHTRRHVVSVSPPKGSHIHGEGKISLRVDQPVEGCQVMTYCMFRSSEGDIDDRDVEMQFRWYRSSLRRACSNVECPRQGDGNVLLLVAKLECVVCCQQGIARDHSCFCSPDCFRLAWHKHKKVHETMATRNQSPETKPWKTHLNNIDALCPRREDSWIEIPNQAYVVMIQ